MLKSLRKYAGYSRQADHSAIPVYKSGDADAPPIIWETGNIGQIRSLLVLREAELVVAKTHLTGNPSDDWYARNRILDLEMKIADLRKWLVEAMEKHEH